MKRIKAASVLVARSSALAAFVCRLCFRLKYFSEFSCGVLRLATAAAEAEAIATGSDVDVLSNVKV
jgi:hypothetical protein